MLLGPGTRLGPYEIVSSLGAGGMGEVYRARDAALGREVAVKILGSSFARDADRLRRFRQEAQSTALLNHPNIVAIHFVGEHDGTPFLVSELLEGESVRERLRKGPLPVRKCMDFAAQIIEGLAAAHEKGIIHRDLKPENIFLTKDGRAKILDFGLAKPVDNSPISEMSPPTLTQGSAPGVVLGTVGYMSPEQVRGQQLDVRSDIFSLGVVLYEMLSGKNAFLRGTSADTMSALLKEEPADITQSSPGISPGIDRVVRRALEKEPTDRFQSVRDLGFALQAVSVNSSAAIPVNPGSKGGRLKFVVGALFVAGLFTAALGGYMLANHWAGSANSTQPEFQQLTFRRGTIRNARFAPDGQTIIYAGLIDGSSTNLYQTRTDSPESTRMGQTKMSLLSVSPLGELAVALGCLHSGNSQCEGTLARMPLSGGAPREVMADVRAADWTPDGKQLAIDRRSGARYVVEFPMGKTIYSTTGWISALRVSPDGRFVAIADHPAPGNDAGSVMVWNSEGKRIVIAGPWNSLEGIAWNPSGAEVWFAASAGRGAFADQIRSVDLAGRQRMLVRMPGITRLHDISRDGHVLLTKEEWRSVMPYQGPGNAKERDLSWLDLSALCDLAPDNQSVIFSEVGQASRDAYFLYQRKTDGSPAVKLGDAVSGALSPDGKWVLAASADNPSHLELLPTGAGEANPLPSGGLLQFGSSSWTRDGKLIAFAGSDGRTWRFYLQDLAGGMPRAFTSEVASVSSEDTQLVSPDSKFLFARDVDRKGVLFPLDGSQQREVRGLQPEEAFANWAEDSQNIFVYRADVYPVEIVKLNAFTGTRRVVREIRPEDPVGLDFLYSVRLSRDEHSIVYSYRRSYSELYLVTGLK